MNLRRDAMLLSRVGGSASSFLTVGSLGKAASTPLTTSQRDCDTKCRIV